MLLRYGSILLPLLTFSVMPATAQQACGERVTIQSGDTLGAIANRCGTSVRAIQKANPELSNPKRLRIGSELMIPESAGQERPAAVPDSGDSAAKPGGADTYVVEQGDTWDKISEESGASVEALMNANPEIASIALNVGATIRIPPERDARERDQAGDKGPAPVIPSGGVAMAPDNVKTSGSNAASSGMSSEGNIQPKGIRVVGKLTGEGVECPALRALDGTLYTLAGDVDQFKEGDQVVVTGSKAETSSCMQGTTIAVEKIAPAP